MENLEKRVIALEEKFSHQDYLLNELNLIVSKQDLMITKLVEHIKNINTGGEGDAKSLNIDNLKDEIPPHY